MDANKSQNNINIRHDWYQTEAYVVVTILSRNLKEEDLCVNYTETNLNVDIKLPTLNTYTLKLNLAHKIIPANCSFKMMSTKVEIKLRKLDGIQWCTLEGDAEHELYTVIPTEINSCSGPLVYPSSNPVHRDWDAIERDIVREFSIIERPEGQDGVNTLFQKVYGEGDDEVKRAMNKSFVESGGTVLSTNWREISKDTVPIKPPDGMEWKEWQ